MPQPQLESIETQLIRRVCGGEPEAFEELVRPFERLVYLTAISILRNQADAEEVAQEAVLKAYRNLANFREGVLHGYVRLERPPHLRFDFDTGADVYCSTR